MKYRATKPDPLTRSQRSYNMSQIRGSNTKPELLVRRALHKRGLRYCLHVGDLPGKPDLTFKKRRAVIFVHGCFWHGHDCPKGVMPATNEEFWVEKIARNRARDSKVEGELFNDGWRVLTVWECALRGRAKICLSAITDEIVDWLVEGGALREISGAWKAGEPDRSGGH